MRERYVVVTEEGKHLFPHKGVREKTQKYTYFKQKTVSYL